MNVTISEIIGQTRDRTTKPRIAEDSLCYTKAVLRSKYALKVV